MDENESYIVKRQDLAEIIRSQNEQAIEGLLKDPLAVIAAAVNEYLLHPSAFASAGIRIAHAALKGTLFQQFATEIADLRQKGKLADDFSKNKYGYDTWVDLLKIIDDEVPDEDRLEALKAMFYAANGMKEADGERIVAYQLFQIAKKLSSNELLILKALWQQKLEGSTTHDANNFYLKCQAILGHGETDLIILGYSRLPELRLAESYRLTALGSTFCANIDKYRIDTGNKV
jgi:hypothetical protein